MAPIEAEVPQGAYRVLITGFGPFGKWKENPSWLAVQRLHNALLETTTPTPRPIHLTAVEIPTIYTSSLTIVPALHARPPTFAREMPPEFTPAPPPPEGYDLVFHVGVGRGLRLEKMGHKYGYNLPDASGELAPIVSTVAAEVKASESEAERFERERLLSQASGNGQKDGVIRGFASGYEVFAEELHTSVDVDTLVEHLQAQGVSTVAASVDAGRYLCDFTYYCSLAEAQRTKQTAAKTSTVQFLHVSGVADLPTGELVEVLKKIVVWIASKQ